MMADASNAGATGTALLTLWKVGRVELPRITKVYRDALAGLDGAKNADVAGPGEVFALWVKVRGELRACPGPVRAPHRGRGRRGVPGDRGVHRRRCRWQEFQCRGRPGALAEDQRSSGGRPRGSGTEPAAGTATRNRSGRSVCTDAGAGATAASAATPDYLAELTTKAEEVKRLAIAKKKDDSRAFGDWIDDQFRAYSDKVNTAYGEWAEAYEQWQKQRPRHGADGPPAPDKPLQLDRIPTSELKAAYDKEVESSYDWIVPAFQEWAASDPDVFTEHIAAIRGAEGRLRRRRSAPARDQRADQSRVAVGRRALHEPAELPRHTARRAGQPAGGRADATRTAGGRAGPVPAGARQHAAARRQCPRCDRGQRRGGQARDTGPI